jgi:hypothetical protein
MLTVKLIRLRTVWFFVPSILIGISLVYTDDIFLSMFTDGVRDEQIWLVNITIKYQPKKFVSVSICIHQFSSSDTDKFYRYSGMFFSMEICIIFVFLLSLF